MSRTREVPESPEHVSDEAIKKRKELAKIRQAKPEGEKPNGK